MEEQLKALLKEHLTIELGTDRLPGTFTDYLKVTIKWDDEKISSSMCTEIEIH